MASAGLSKICPKSITSFLSFEWQYRFMVVSILVTTACVLNLLVVKAAFRFKSVSGFVGRDLLESS